MYILENKYELEKEVEEEMQETRHVSKPDILKLTHDEVVGPMKRL